MVWGFKLKGELLVSHMMITLIGKGENKAKEKTGNQ
jgi:hypothetical protein